MKTFELIKMKQKIWSMNAAISLQGSKKERGEKNYTRSIEENLYRSLSVRSKNELLAGDGNEFGNDTNPGKIQALHSSSALVVNFFEYWKANDTFSPIAKAIRIPSTNISSIAYESKYPILLDKGKHPNIDVCFKYNNGTIIGIECKFTEPFQNRNANHGLKGKYLKEKGIWDELPNLRKLASKISPNDNEFKYLHCAQLIKHTLGLLNALKNKSKFRLVYLYYPALMGNNEKYFSEIEIFAETMAKDDIRFSSITWQQIIKYFINNLTEQDRDYVNYITSRYL